MKNRQMNRNMRNAKIKNLVKATVPKAHDSQTRGNSVITITRTKRHTLKPRIFGYMSVIKCHLLPAYLLSQEPRFFFCLDGLPSQTNTRKNEPDFAKNRKNDFLAPSLFFFATKERFDEFAVHVESKPVRSVQFQRAFAQYAKGVFCLKYYVVDITVDRCLARLSALKNRTVRLPRGEEDTREVNDTCMFVCNDRECHRFQLADSVSRNTWLARINKLVNKRKATFTPVASALHSVIEFKDNSSADLPALDESQNSFGRLSDKVLQNNNQSLLEFNSIATVDTPVFSNNRQVNDNVISRGSSASIAKRMARLSKVEGDFD
jgi:hypothetical protein